MAEADAREDACRDYQSSLEDLTFNSKPHINMLTILAEENVQFAKDIVSLIEAQIAKAPTTEKLPVMYLMDSIVKNVGRDYLAAFAKILVSTFVNVFEKVDENTRKSLYKLRSTWDEIFPSKKLFALDVRVNSLDPAWPVKPLPPNVNTASIHVNPKFLNKSEEAPAVAAPPPSPAPPRPNNTETQKHLSQEQLIRQQLLVKQKQLLELQQKKLELELEQTKAQLASSISVPVKPHPAPEIHHLPTRAPHPTPANPEKTRVPGPPQPHEKPHDKSPVPTRDPRLVRVNQHSSHANQHSSHANQHSAHAKDQSHKKDAKSTSVSPTENKAAKPLSSEKPSFSKPEKPKSGEKPAKRETLQAELKRKSTTPSPLKAKIPHLKSQSAESPRDPELIRRDPRLRKHLGDKTDEKEGDAKEKRKSAEKKEDHKSTEHRPAGNRNKLVNGVAQKNESNADSDKTASKSGRVNNRVRSRSPLHSPKRRERRSPKRRQRSLSPIPSLLKIGKLRPPANKPSHAEDFPPNVRDERNKRSAKADARDGRRPKRTSEEKLPDPAAPLSNKPNSDPKENTDGWQGSKPSKRRCSWEENKTPQKDDHPLGNRSSYARHRDSWPGNNGVQSPRTPKQQPFLSVDANLKIPKELTSASKGELLQKANERLASGEITQDEFLVVAHQIRQLFQYQEEKQRCNVWDSPTAEGKGGARKKPLLSNAELTYYEHKARLRRTQVQHPLLGRDFSDSEYMDFPLDDLVPPGHEGEYGGRNEQFPERHRRMSPVPGARPHEEDAIIDGHRRHEERRELAKGLREKLPFNEPKRSRYEELDQAPFGDSPDLRLIGKEPNSKHGALLDEIRPMLDVPLRVPATRVDGAANKGFEEPSNISSLREGSPANASMQFEAASGGQAGPQCFEAMPVQPVDALFEPRGGSAIDGPMFEGGQNQVVAPNIPMGPQRLELSQGQPLGVQRFDGGQTLGPQRFEGAPGQPLGPQRFEGAVGPQRYGGSPRPPFLQQRFDGVQGPPMRFEQPMGFDNAGQSVGSVRFDGPPGPRFDQPPRFDHGPGPQPIMRFDAPMGQGGPRFEGGPRFDGAPRFDGVPINRFEGQPPLMSGFDMPHVQPCQRFEGPPRHQTQPRFDGPLQMQPRFDGPLSQRFDGHNQQMRFEMPIGHQRPPYDVNPPAIRQNAPPYGQTGPYPEHQNVFHGPSQGMPFQRQEQRFEMSQGPNFSAPAAPGFPNQVRPPGPYFDDKNPQGPQFGSFNNVPVGNLQPNQPFPTLGGMVQPALYNPEQTFAPPAQGPNAGVFANNQQAGAFPFPENHLGQVDVNELFSKLLSTGILKLSQSEASSQSTMESPEVVEPASQPPAADEEEDEPAEDNSVPDLTSFTMEDLKRRYDSIINRLYTGIQCYSCGMRFTKSQTDVYADHLDWHYRQNRTEKDVSRKITHRRWYYSLQDWIEFEEIADLEERAKSNFFEKVHEEVILKTQEAAKEKEFQSVVAGPAGSDELCDICQEQFEQYWDEEEEEWHLRNAMRVNDKIYHPSCYDDYKNTSSFLDNTPSPSKTLLENPLNAMLTLVKEEEPEPLPAVTVKEEPSEAPVTSCSESIPLLAEIKPEPAESDAPLH
ncbi:pre-mRNA cleavage complex 2 protein Pcf11 isoform X2 [Spea bombifrons]|uniref:pre-mRNA cleavage complex 2 protein Pcf11 isoform X2 n=1 Tax=Spea bombifrons TaxID=233779 RepID=UPI002349C939|nr:pre-mRNA cleavage complex 2 protein Pcf11 isoform X2 [Spea bombifrons]